MWILLSSSLLLLPLLLVSPPGRRNGSGAGRANPLLGRALLSGAVVSLLSGILAPHPGTSLTLLDGRISTGYASSACVIIVSLTLLGVTLLSGWGIRTPTGGWGSLSLSGESLTLIGIYSGAMAVLPSSEELVTSLTLLALANLSLYPVLGASPSRGGGESRLSVSVRYLLLGALSTILFGAGVALTYGSLGTTEVGSLASLVPSLASVPCDGSPFSSPVLLGVSLIGAGLILKVGAVPLSGWVPDTYGGCSPTLAALIVTVPKLPLLVLLGRVALPVTGDSLLVPGVLSLILGTAAMAGGETLRRWVAFSTIAHTGYMILLLVGSPPSLPGNGGNGYGPSSVDLGGLTLYVSSYLPPTLILLGMGIALSRGRDGSLTSDGVASLSGLGIRNRGLTLPLAVSLLSLLGLPPLAGFAGKIYLLSSLSGSGGTLTSCLTPHGLSDGTHLYDGRGLALVGLVVISSLIGAGGYLRMARISLFTLPLVRKGVTLAVGGSASLGVSILTLLTVLLPWGPASLLVSLPLLV